MSIVLVRDPAGSPVNYAQARQQGWTPAFPSNDPNLAADMAAARAAGVEPAIWVPAGAYPNPEEYGRAMAGVVQTYGPSAIVANVEQEGEGAAGSEWSRRMVAEYSKYVPKGTGPQLSVAVEYNKTGDVWDYSAYQAYGANVMGEAFTGNSGTPADADHERQALLAAGWKPEQIAVMLRPGQAAGTMPGAVAGYTWDDAVNNPNWLASLGQTQGTSPTGQPTTPSAPGAPAGPDVSALNRQHAPDAQNPAAVAYARQRLAQLAKMGYTPDEFGLEGLDPTAQWRAMSALMGATQAAGAGATYETPAGTDPRVAAQIETIMGRTPQQGVGGRSTSPGTTPPSPLTPHTETPLPPGFKLPGQIGKQTGPRTAAPADPRWLSAPSSFDPGSKNAALLALRRQQPNLDLRSILAKKAAGPGGSLFNV